MTRRIEPQPAGPNGPMLPLLQVIILQDAWRALTKKSQAALLAWDTEDPSAVIHPASARALRAHGLLDDKGLTEAGRAVVRHRPGQSGGQHG